ncbi:hypothetical protein BD289DRAFT_482608 [Coniella lustricola]|uniref:Ras guanine nucleotide exchange factor domain-containing protein n=1 Tax=Coniella lustricola TaxID=2025994 RepID=A0A2T3A886_9PEZI|nr:hypothetical protein BD289DRAFT_482608 [Coniella lustricola]
MTSEEMDPDIDPPLLPHQATRPRPSTGSNNARISATKPDCRPAAARRVAQPPTQRGLVAKVPTSTKAALRATTQFRQPRITAKRPSQPGAPIPVPPKTAPAVSHGLADATTSKAIRAVAERGTRDLLPARRRPTISVETERSDITPDGGSGGREGRRFAVSNVGNNGRIYLRPTVRPAFERHQQPTFVFPMTPPQTAGPSQHNDIQNKRPNLLDVSRLDDSQWASSLGPETPTNQPLQTLLHDRRFQTPAAHRRAMSDSTIHDVSVARESGGGFRVVITKPGDDNRPKTLEDIDSENTPHLEILIPSWKLGTPRWSTRGTPFIRGSSYAPTEEFRSGQPSPALARFRPSSVKIPSLQLSGALRSPFMDSPQISPEEALRSTYLSTYQAIEPIMYDALTFKPACDDQALVRYSPSTGAVTAATPPRLVAEITSPSFLDYELLSDFFLTFRSFLAPLDLLRMLFARMRWSLTRDDETGTVVRVRTFVALRHWILNYFVDDFVCDYEMRTNFCTLTNSLAEEMAEHAKERPVQLKILAELKKCWSRVCAQFWDGPEFDTHLPPETPITPGGIPGLRDPNLDPGIWEQSSPHDEPPPQLDAIYAPLSSNPPDIETSFLRDVAQIGSDRTGAGGHRPQTPLNQVNEKTFQYGGQLSPSSISSVDVISCSFPFRFGVPRAKNTPAAHPADPDALHLGAEPVAAAPRAYTEKPMPRRPSHKRNNSTSNSLREGGSTLEQMLQKNTETITALPYAGSLVRGNVFPPGQAFVEVFGSNAAKGPSRQTTYLRLETHESVADTIPPSAMSGQGMRRLISNVRRALSSKGQEMSPTQGNFNITPIGPRGVTANRLPGTAVVPQPCLRPNANRPPVRIDLLGAEVVEDFKKVVREDAAEAAMRSLRDSVPSVPSTVQNPVEIDAQHINSLLTAPHQSLEMRPISEGGITAGSKSILIFDDTRASHEHPVMAGALPLTTPSVEAFAESFMPPCADPTPPQTPPGRSAEIARRSSHLLGQQVLRSVRSAEDLAASAVYGDASFEDDASLHRAEDYERPSHYPRRRSSNDYSLSSARRPLSGMPHLSRNESNRSLLSNGTMGPRRRASFHSGMQRQSPLQSYVAQNSDTILEQHSEVPVANPLRLLRRRPGGDLRAVSNVGDLGLAGLRRSRSIGSLTTGTYMSSIGTSLIQSVDLGRESTGLLDIVNGDYSNDRPQVFSVGMLADKPKRRHSLFSTLSAKPAMRPSFEAAAQTLASIPDDDDDGGVESALLKLEGKYQKKASKLSIEGTSSPLKEVAIADDTQLQTSSLLVSKPEKKYRRNEHIDDDAIEAFTSITANPAPHHSRSSSHPVVGNGRSVQEPQVGVVSFLSEGSSNSYTSIPLLQRGLTDDGRRSRQAWASRSVLEHRAEDGTRSAGKSSRKNEKHTTTRTSSSIKRHRSKEAQAGQGSTTVNSSQISEQTASYLVDVNDDDLSSEMSDIVEDEDDEDLLALPSLRVGARLKEFRSDDSQRYQADGEQLSPTMAPQASLSSRGHVFPDTQVSYMTEIKPLPLTPQDTPTFSPPDINPEVLPGLVGERENSRLAGRRDEQAFNMHKCSAHLPFILAFESEVLAQQFTLIEKDALDDIDWKELIDMRWRNAENKDARSWVHFLRDADARGVEVVIARFNIMVKWAISEIVLTKDLEERARSIIKYIHIAMHCRRYRNFATMSQLAVALTSTEVSRLAKTWTLVPAHDTRALHELESLISPTRNFYALRAEMEGGGLASASMGCIPFVGIYTHDLIFNAQRPIEIASSPTTAPLVNFERCRIAAGIVKALLRLLEASALYNFQPIEGITERCLWMSALSDDEIRRHSQGLE